jgi:hypothetical protein
VVAEPTMKEHSVKCPGRHQGRAQTPTMVEATHHATPAPTAATTAATATGGTGNASPAANAAATVAAAAAPATVSLVRAAEYSSAAMRCRVTAMG